MVTGFLYKIRIRGKLVDIFSCDCDYAQGMSNKGHKVSACRYKTVGGDN